LTFGMAGGDRATIINNVTLAFIKA